VTLKKAEGREPVALLWALLLIFLRFGNAPVGLGVMAEPEGMSLPREARVVLVVGFFASQGYFHPEVAILLATAAGRVRG